MVESVALLRFPSQHPSASSTATSCGVASLSCGTECTRRHSVAQIKMNRPAHPWLGRVIKEDVGQESTRRERARAVDRTRWLSRGAELPPDTSVCRSNYWKRVFALRPRAGISTRRCAARRYAAAAARPDSFRFVLRCGFGVASASLVAVVKLARRTPHVSNAALRSGRYSWC